MHSIIQNLSGAGKSALLDAAIRPFKLVSKDDIIEVGRFTGPSLQRYGSFDGKILYHNQAFGDEPQTVLPLLSEGNLGLMVTEREENSYKFVTKIYNIEGYPILLEDLVLGQIGLYGRIGMKMREEKGIACYSLSSLVARSFSGPIAIYAGLNPRNLINAIETIMQELSRICSEEIGEGELSAGKRKLIGSLSISLDTLFESVGIIHDIEYYSLGGSKYFHEFEKLINSVTPDQILKAFREYANFSKLSMAFAGPIQDEEQLQMSINRLLQSC